MLVHFSNAHSLIRFPSLFLTLSSTGYRWPDFSRRRESPQRERGIPRMFGLGSTTTGDVLDFQRSPVDRIGTQDPGAAHGNRGDGRACQRFRKVLVRCRQRRWHNEQGFCPRRPR